MFIVIPIIIMSSTSYSTITGNMINIVVTVSLVLCYMSMYMTIDMCVYM
jgi:hypothetical protein